MKLHKIKQGYILTSDEEIKEGNLILSDERDNIQQNNGNPIWKLEKVEKTENKWIFVTGRPDEGLNPDWCKKVIAQQSQIIFSELTKEEQKLIGWFDVFDVEDNKNIHKWVQDVITEQKHWLNAQDSVEPVYYGIVKGFQKAQELLSDRMFTYIEKQLIDFKHDLRETTSNYVKQNSEGAIFGLNRLKESLQSKSWSVEAIEENGKFKITKIL